MITMQEWVAMGGMDRTTWMHENCQVNGLGGHRKPLFGVGVNDAPYCTNLRIDGVNVMCPAYIAWTRMLERAYSTKLHAKRTTYIGVSICDEWRNFRAFRTWWIENQVDGWQVDKDILSDTGVYSPETCLFVPAWLNTFTLDRGASRGEWPIGVYFHKDTGRFLAQCSNPIAKKRESLGYFHTPEAAHLAWRARKLELALELKPKMDEIDLRIYQQVVEIINNAK